METAIEEPKRELLVLTINPIEVFTGGGVRPFLDSIKEEARSIVTDPSTEKGRKEIASLAYKIARTKTALDDAGKSLTEDSRKLIERVNEERRIVRDELDTLKDEVRSPLTEYENREKIRVAGHESRISAIASLTDFLPSDSAGIAAIIAEAKATNLDDFQEFRSRAETTLQAALHRLESAYTSIKEYEEKTAREEAERIERQRIEREEREAKIAAEAAEKARLAAEEEARVKAEAEAARVKWEQEEAERKREEERKAEAERLAEVQRQAEEQRQKAEAARIAEEAAQKARFEAAEREKADAEARVKAAEAETARQVALANEKAAREAEEKEKARLAEIEAQRLADEKRAANAKHRKAVIAEIASDLSTELHLADELAGAVAEAIAAGKIRNINVQF